MKQVYPNNEEELISKIRGLQKIKPDSLYLNSYRRIILAQVENEQSVKNRNLFIYQFVRFALVSVSTLALLGLVGLGITSASQNSAPGSIFYPFKLTTEKIQLSLTDRNHANRANLYVKFAKNRLQEIQHLESSTSPDSQTLLATLNLYSDNIKAIQNELDELNQIPEDQRLDFLSKWEIQLAETTQTIASLKARLNGQNSNPQITLNFNHAQQLSQFTQTVISLKILEYENSRQILINNGFQKQRLLSFYSQLQSRFDNLNQLWNQEVLAPKTQNVESSTQAPEKSQSYNLSSLDQQTLTQFTQLKTEFNQIQVQLNEPALSDSDYLTLIKHLFEIDTKLATIEATLE